jgi:peptidoglycan/LPS O-acetylase OafA/YrhL
MKYRAEVDGLRAVAVIPVILFHGGFRAFSGGFVGVDIFFVISGFLITTLIASDISAGRFSFLDFYERRARRILPALFLVLMASTVFAWLWMFPHDLAGFSASVIAVCAFVSNLLFWRQTGYFSPTSEMIPLLHTWSLAVEEQYYILFPILMVFLWRFGRRPVIWSIAVLALGSLVLCQFASVHNPTFNFYSAPTRAWELLAGALCSFAVFPASKARDNLLALAGAVAVVFSIFWFTAATPFPSAWALVPVGGTCLLLTFASKETLVGQVLSHRLLVGLGLISYSAYLWHQPLFVFARLRSLTTPDAATMLGLAILSCCLAYLSWRYVEVPLRRKNSLPLPSRSAAFSAFGAVGAALAAVAAIGYFSAGLPARLSPSVTALIAGGDRGNPRTSACHAGPSFNLPPENSCIYGNEQHIGVALMGDSHADAIAHRLGLAFDKVGLGMRELTYSGCLPVAGYQRRTDYGLYPCAAYHAVATKYLAEQPNINIVVLFARWPLYIEFNRFDNGEGGVEDGTPVIPEFLDASASPRDADPHAHVARLMQDTVRELLAMGKHVVLIYGQPEMGWDVPRFLARAEMFGAAVTRPMSTSQEVIQSRSARANAALDAIGEDANLVRVRPEEMFCNTLIPHRCAAENATSVLYLDDDHVNDLGADMISAEVIAQVKAKGWLAP